MMPSKITSVAFNCTFTNFWQKEAGFCLQKDDFADLHFQTLVKGIGRQKELMDNVSIWKTALTAEGAYIYRGGI